MSDSRSTGLQSERPDATGRRDFLTKTALAGAALALSSVRTAASQNQPASSDASNVAQKLVAVASCGRWKSQVSGWASKI